MKRRASPTPFLTAARHVAQEHCVACYALRELSDAAPEHLQHFANLFKPANKQMRDTWWYPPLGAFKGKNGRWYTTRNPDTNARVIALILAHLIWREAHS